MASQDGEKRGRKKLPPGKRRKEHIHIWLTSDEKRRIKAHAKQLGQAHTIWARITLLSAIKE